MHNAKKNQIDCFRCKTKECVSGIVNRKADRPIVPKYCPTKKHTDLVEEANRLLFQPENQKLAIVSSTIENSCFKREPSGSIYYPMMPLRCRIEEVMWLADDMGYKKLGIAFCTDLKNETEILTEILEFHGFEVVSVCCKAGAVPVQEIGVKEGEKMHGPESFETMCSGIIAAELLNDENADMNILMGLCVGQDSLFFRYAKATTVPVVVQDKIHAHNSTAALHCTSTPYGDRLLGGPAKLKIY